jgi:3-phenylpropionate/trans-cinnamate dioxygenase ferredoxin reductase component
MTDNRSVLIIGAGLGGLRVAEELRQLDFPGSVTLVGDEPFAPYDRPPLSKDVLKGTRPNPPILCTSEQTRALDIELITRHTATVLDTVRQRVTFDDGSDLPYDVLVIATGARPRHWGMSTGAENAWPLRTSADAASAAAAIAAKARIAVLGAGFIGCEVAASAREMGCEVTLIELLPAPLAHIVGSEAAGEIARRHVAAGVDLRVESTIEDVVLESGRMTWIALSDGSSVRVDALVYGLGVVPNTEWLESAGVIIENGVICDAAGATSHPNVYAVGDVARWVNVNTGRHVRVEHWTTTTVHAKIVASQITEGVHARRRLDEVPYFWSDQYGTKIQSMGEPSASADVNSYLTGTSGDRPLYLYSRAGILTGVLGFSLPKVVMSMGPLLAKGAPLSEAVRLAEGVHQLEPIRD